MQKITIVNEEVIGDKLLVTCEIAPHEETEFPTKLTARDVLHLVADKYDIINFESKVVRSSSTLKKETFSFGVKNKKKAKDKKKVENASQGPIEG
jgi:hypothetical protein